MLSTVKPENLKEAAARDIFKQNLVNKDEPKKEKISLFETETVCPRLLPLF